MSQWGFFKWGQAPYVPRPAFRHVEVQITKERVGTTPVWDRATSIVAPYRTPEVAIDSVIGHYEYDARLRYLDVYGQASPWSDFLRHLTIADANAPAKPTGFTLSAQRSTVLATWNASPELDFAYYEFRWAPDDGSKAGPGTGAAWTYIQTLLTNTIITDTAGIKIWAQVRAIDRSGNPSDWA